MTKTLKCSILIFACILANSAFAQFSTPNNDNEVHHLGGVGVGLSNPSTFFHVYQNNGGTGTSTGMMVEQDGTGDALLQFLLTSTRRWQMGIDNSNNDSFIISEGSGLGSSDRLTITTDGKVGIGTNVPSYKLTIKTSNEQHLRFENGSELGLIKLLDNGNFNFWAHGSDAITFSNGSGSGNESMRIASDGKVGIGTNAPNYHLDVLGSINGGSYRVNGEDLATSWNRRIQVSANTVPTDGEGVEIGYDDASNNGVLVSYDRNNSAFTNMNYNSYKHVFKASGSDKMIINHDGRVGIGQSNPNYLLDVAGSVNGTAYRVNGEHLATSWDRRIQVGANTIPTSGEGVEIGYDDASNDGILVSYDRNNSAFANMNYNGLQHVFKTSGNDRMVIASDGKVGIGTGTPDSELTVNGVIHAKKVLVDTDIWPDYVFKSTYDLRSLESTAAFIEENHHLPEIPSAAEVEENGIDVAEMNKLLLQKVEEMTLHIIDIHTHMKDMEGEINELKQQIEQGK